MKMLVRVHLSLTVFWILFLVPTYLFWQDNIFLILFASFYANAGLHLGAYQGVRAERAAGESSNG